MQMNADERQIIFDNFRRWGYLQAQFDSFHRLKPIPHPALEIEGDVAAQARQCYCGSIGVEFMHIPDIERCRWVQEKMENNSPISGRHQILKRLVYTCLLYTSPSPRD